MKVAFITPYPYNQAPSQRFRFEQYFKYLNKEGIKYTQSSFFSEKAWNNLYSSGGFIIKVYYTILGFLKRLFTLFTLYNYDFVFIHREATPLGLPWFEFIVSKILNKKIIFDFDDAIWLPDKSGVNSIGQILKNPSKVKSICKWSYKVSVGNQYLAEFASKFNNNVTIIPTTLDTSYHKPENDDETNNNLVTIGWTGTHSTLKYLIPIFPAIKELQQKIHFNFQVICNEDPSPDLNNYTFIKWSKEREIEDLSKIDIGIMPLPDDQWTKGKCGFKALQYLSLGKPAIVSPVGVNEEIVSHGNEGFLARNNEDWKNFISILISNHSLRKEMGQKGIKKVENEFSTVANKQKFLNLFT
ncbi:glycosyltransferase [Marinigracilibium pacificum]|uniref:Glycosyltransferase n=1 Tax=Marinigracilibium pacificum TaxID=2729599 RepID=A0A848J6R0_9BACT|nr:glycosyltransferase [Marinigracilibium pacificum]NMM48802.1 glycosyltransferase [Marinigracilibium pacificum]